ncbi:MAG: hypothetical protein HS099_00605 [Ardenticatenaceae bacterium]|nr:hypothetical protein [Ardenticatenaceae bacterium]
MENPGLGNQTIRLTFAIAGQAVAMRVMMTGGGNGNIYHLYNDHLGSLSSIGTSTSNLVNGSRTYYKPFGGYRGTAPTQTITDRDFTGQRENMELGLLYYNARFYAPYINRFVSADSIVPDPANPQSYNRYSYARNNPMTHT